LLLLQFGVFCSFMMANRATGRSTEHCMMSGHVAGDAAYRGALEASGCLGRG
jgi:hypothetical protein